MAGCDSLVIQIDAVREPGLIASQDIGPLLLVTVRVKGRLQRCKAASNFSLAPQFLCCARAW